MKVRNRLYKPNEYEGHWIVAGKGGLDCPCLPCFRIHNCSYYLYGKRFDSWDCVTRHNEGCPEVLKEPRHIIGKNGRCKRCGQIIAKKMKSKEIM